MAYRVSYRTSFERDIKGFKKAKQQVAEIKSSVTEIVEDPTVGEPLSGNWKGFISYHFSRKPEMRILYIVYPCCSILQKLPVSACRFETDLEEADEVDTDTCQGHIEFIRVATREEFNNLYALHKKHIPKPLE